MSNGEIRNYAVAIVASIGVLSGLQLLVPNARARPVQVYPTSRAGPMTLRRAGCAGARRKLDHFGVEHLVVLQAFERTMHGEYRGGHEAAEGPPPDHADPRLAGRRGAGRTADLRR